MEMIGRLKIKVCSDKLVKMEQLPYYTLVPGEVALDVSGLTVSFLVQLLINVLSL